MPLALFDLDFTLIEGDCEWLWSEFLVDQRVVGDGFLHRILQFYHEYEAGQLDVWAYESFLLEPLTRLSMESMLGLRARYIERIHTLLRPYMCERIQWHHSQGHSLLVITASNSFLARPIVELFNITDLICTEIELVNNKPTGRITGVPAFREGKVQRLQTWLAENNQALDESWGYSDSHNDLPLLQQVAHPVAVTPDPILAAHALDHGWEIIR